MLVKISAVLLSLCALVTTGCFGLTFGGNHGATTHTHTHNYSAPTLAQELSELKKVRDEGGIAEEEYALAKNQLINSYNAQGKTKEMAGEEPSGIQHAHHEEKIESSEIDVKLVSPKTASELENDVEKSNPFK